METLVKHCDYLNDMLVFKYGASARDIRTSAIIYVFIKDGKSTEVFVPIDSMLYAIRTAGIPKELFNYLS